MATPKRGKSIALTAGGVLLVLFVLVGILYEPALRSWYAFWLDFESLGKNDQGRPEYRHRETGIVFVRLPGGTFDMGSPETEAGRGNNEGRVHRVTLSPFLIAKYEVSQAEWRKVMGNSPSRSRGNTLPVDFVSWEDCQEFCKKTGLLLPTEAQWEHACRAGSSAPFAGTGDLDDMGWYGKNSFGATHPVGEKLPNDFGIYDMHGNVWELCEDLYQEDFYQESTGARDPLCENSGSGFRVLRSGCFGNSAKHCRSASRLSFHPSDRSHVGFRPAWSWSSPKSSP